MKLLFIDTQTNGLPTNKYAPYTATEMWPHILEISWQIIDSDNWEVVKSVSYFIELRANWNTEAERIHQIPESIIRNFGKTPNLIFNELFKDANICQYLIGHNVNYITTAILAEVQRLDDQGYNLKPAKFWSGIKTVCTMKLTKTFCGLRFPNSNDYKFPRLSELYLKLFNNTVECDVECLVKCCRELLTKPEFSDVLV